MRVLHIGGSAHLTYVEVGETLPHSIRRPKWVPAPEADPRRGTSLASMREPKRIDVEEYLLERVVLFGLVFPVYVAVGTTGRTRNESMLRVLHPDPEFLESVSGTA